MLSLHDYFINISLNRISKIFKRVSGSWRLSSKTRGRLLSQRRKYKNAHKYTNGNKSNGNGILSGFDYDAFVNAFESLATGLNQDRTGIGQQDQDFYHFWTFWPFLTALTIFDHIFWDRYFWILPAILSIPNQQSLGRQASTASASYGLGSRQNSTNQHSRQNSVVSDGQDDTVLFGYQKSEDFINEFQIVNSLVPPHGSE